MERKFIYPVAMPCNDDQFEKELKEPLRSLGYKVDAKFFSRDLISNVWNGTFKIALINQCDAGIDARHLISYNPELFLALAAMSEGPEFWPGEWAVCTWKGSTKLSEGTLFMVSKIDDDRGHARIWWVNEFGNEEWMYLYPTKENINPNFRKATAEEIIAHFTKEPSFFDQISGEADNLDVLTTESLTELYDIAAEEKGQASTSSKKDVPLSEKVDKMVEDLNAMADHAEKVLNKVWEPQKCEKVRVRNSDNEGWQNRFFLFPTIGGFCCVDENEFNHYLSGDRFVVQMWRYAEPIPKTIEVSTDELLKVYSQHTGTDLQLLKVKK